jgi:hypothetical protein
MANSKLLKEAIADAKAVRETAIANAKIALQDYNQSYQRSYKLKWKIWMMRK